MLLNMLGLATWTAGKALLQVRVEFGSIATVRGAVCMETIAIFPTVPSDDGGQPFVAKEIVLRRPVAREPQQAVSAEPEAGNLSQAAVALFEHEEPTSLPEEPAGTEPAVLAADVSAAAQSSEVLAEAAAGSASAVNQASAELVVATPASSATPATVTPDSAPVAPASMVPASMAPPQATRPRRRQQRRPAGRASVAEQRQSGRWGSVAVLAAIAAVVWLAVLAVERQPLDEAPGGSQSLRIAAEPEFRQPAGGRSVR
jgi:hypothetical protein